MKKQGYKTGWFAAMLMLAATPALADSRPVVLELYTSQGCSSCPPADALLQKLASEEAVLALSFHVHYWDYLGWKDPFSSEANTARQRAYAHMLKDSVYTPMMVIDGGATAVGSNEDKVRAAIAAARKDFHVVPISIAGNEVALAGLSEADKKAFPMNATVWAVEFVPFATTPVHAGENDGATIVNIDNVVKMTRLGDWKQDKTQFALPPVGAGNQMAVLVQADGQGRVIGAAMR